MEDIIYADYMHAKRIYKDFEIKKVRWISWFILRYITLADIFENFRKMCLIIYQLNPEKFLSAPGLVWPAALKIC